MGRRPSSRSGCRRSSRTAAAMAAQVSAGKLRAEEGGHEAAARAALDAAERRVRDDDAMQHRSARPGRPAGAAHRRRSATASARGSCRARARRARRAERRRQDDAARAAGGGLPPDRLGESRASAGIADSRAVAPARSPGHTDRVGYLPQRVDGLDEDAIGARERPRTPRPRCPDARAAQPARPVPASAARRSSARSATLSGGERFRVALARLLLADPPPQLLVLDEPTNNLDLDTRRPARRRRSRAYRGAVLVVSHDDVFLAARPRPDARARRRRALQRGVSARSDSAAPLPAAGELVVPRAERSRRAGRRVASSVVALEVSRRGWPPARAAVFDRRCASTAGLDTTPSDAARMLR